jgi:protein-S-isoprenylcysteine O-methyltransferase Ste14
MTERASGAVEEAHAPARPAAMAVRLAIATAGFGAILFATAGTLAWPAAWAYLAIMTTALLAYTAVVVRLHPDLIEERRRPPADAKSWDRPLVAIIAGIGPVVFIVLAGLDHRFGWTPPMSAWITVAGLLLVAAGGALTAWAVGANPFFSALVRIQRDRGHAVVERGPYRVVRHPAYIASVVHMAGSGLALGSGAALAANAALTLLVVWRTALEDRTLRSELDGYADYARRVRFRLVPGVW